jgi:hypothetical protein
MARNCTARFGIQFADTNWQCLATVRVRDANNDLKKVNAAYCRLGYAIDNTELSAELARRGIEEHFSGCVISDLECFAGYSDTVEKVASLTTPNRKDLNIDGEHLSVEKIRTLR